MTALITEDERVRLLAHGKAHAAGEVIDPVPVVRLFTSDANLIWLLAALDPADGDSAYGLIDLGALPWSMRACATAHGSTR